MIHINIEKLLHSAEGELNLQINVKVPANSLTTLFGPSGAGKTTLLRILSGLTNPDKGTIQVGSEVWFDSKKKINLPVQKRNIGMVFQDYALFPNMTVRKNLEFAQNREKEPRFVDELLESTGLVELQHRKPTMLSGGQQQRVALARALVRKPSLLLLDEPLSALDPSMRAQLQEEIQRLHSKFSLTTLLVSHDFSEVYKLSDHVVLLKKGTVLRTGKPSDVFWENKPGGKFELVGEILNIEQDEVVHIVTILIEKQLVKVVATLEEVESLKTGDRVMVVTKTMNPILKKI